MNYNFESDSDEPRIIEPKKKERFSFKQVLVIVCMVAALGGVTAGAGIGLGYSIGSRLAYEPLVTEEALPFVFVNETDLPMSPDISFNGYKDVVQSVSDSVVSISVNISYASYFGRRRESESAGSGIIFDMDDDRVYIATNHHVISSEQGMSIESVNISLDDKETVPAMLIGSDAQSDLAVISVLRKDLDELGVPYKCAVFGKSSNMMVGDLVVAIGNAMGEGKTATQGIISAINKNISIDGKKLTVIQTDAAINPGNSGGALVNMNSEVIGINTAKIASYVAEGMGFSIPSDIAWEILINLKETGTTPDPYIGIETITEIDETRRDAYSFPSVGILIRRIIAGSPADTAGLRVNDLIVAFNGVPITSAEDYKAALDETDVGEKAVLSIYRNNNSIEITVVVGDKNADSSF
ncbi:MAG: trypsin-like peptidase domain-containing protein [Defluviitaleaceae bacterium]|nr:trypsin-like peptidase domain-containing protein [Defluviitaleaceae bacterium]